MSLYPEPAPVAVVAPVQSAILSKTIWTQVIGFAASLAAVKGFNISPDMQVQVVIVIQGVTAGLTAIIKTWFTPSVTPASAAKLEKI